MIISITMPSNIIKEEILSSSSYQKGDRLVIRFDDEYYLGTVSKSGAKIYVRFDDGDKESFPKNSKKIIGIGVKQKRKKSFSKKNLDRYLVGKMKKDIYIEIPKKVNWKNLKKNPKNYIKNSPLHILVLIKEKSSEQYYHTGKTLIPDNIYDMVEDAIRDINPKHPTLKKVGAPLPPSVGKVNLPFPMPSLDKIKPDNNSVDKFATKFPGPYVLSDKMDGTSLELIGTKKGWEIYKRGEESIGSDVTTLAPYIKLPKVKVGVALRAEAEITNSKFNKFYKDASENPRNFVSGLLNPKRLEVGKGTGDIRVIAYELFKPRVKPSKQLKKLKSLGFKIAPYKLVDKIDSNILSTLLERRKKASPFDIDGIVVTQDKVHPIAKTNPDWSKSFKMVMDDQIATVKIIKIQWNKSKHGEFRPRIFVTPVRLGGVTVKHCSGFNAFFITHGYKIDEVDKPEKPLGPGAKLRIVRSGDVIPHILEIVKGVKKPQMPKEKYIWENAGVHVRMATKKGMDVVDVKRLNHFFSTLGVEGMKEGTIRQLYDDGLDTIQKIIKASNKRIAKIPGLGNKKANTIRNEIEKAFKGAELHRLMFASGAFPKDLGSQRIKLVLNKYPNILKKKYKPNELIIKLEENIDGFSTKLASSFVKGLPKFKKFLERLPEINYIKPKKIKKVGSKLENETIVFTKFRDKDLARLIEKNGGKVGSGVSSKTTILLVKDIISDSNKVQKAKALGIKIMTAPTFKSKYNLGV